MRKRKRSQWRNPTYIGTVLVAVVFIFIFIVSFINPGGSVDTPADIDIDTVPTIAPTALVVPTPEPGGPLLSFGSPQVQANGLFQVTVPGGWFPNANAYEATAPRARMSFTNTDRLSVIDVLIQFGVNYPSTQALSDDFLTSEYFGGEWSAYGRATETGRTVAETVTVEFDLEADNLEFIGRQISWLDGDWLNMVRLIVPGNNPALLDELERVVTPTLIGYQEDLGDIPPSQAAYVDNAQGFIIRHPGWTRVSGFPGGPAILENPANDSRLLLRASDETPLASLEEAEAYVTDTLRSGVDILSSQVTAREFGEGFLVSYADRDADGNPISGVVALLNNDIERLLLAEVRVPADDLDLLAASEDALVTESRQVIDSFAALPPPGYLIVPGGESPPEEDTE